MYIIDSIVMLFIQFCDCDLSRDSLKHFIEKISSHSFFVHRPLHSRWEIGVSRCSLAHDMILHLLRSPIMCGMDILTNMNMKNVFQFVHGAFY